MTFLPSRRKLSEGPTQNSKDGEEDGTCARIFSHGWLGIGNLGIHDCFGSIRWRIDTSIFVLRSHRAGPSRQRCPDVKGGLNEVHQNGK